MWSRTMSRVMYGADIVGIFGLLKFIVMPSVVTVTVTV